MEVSYHFSYETDAIRNVATKFRWTQQSHPKSACNWKFSWCSCLLTAHPLQRLHVTFGKTVCINMASTFPKIHSDNMASLVGMASQGLQRWKRLWMGSGNSGLWPAACSTYMDVDFPQSTATGIDLGRSILTNQLQTRFKVSASVLHMQLN
jgi:hypothetical protein